jgi:hypothetical protein
MLTYTISHECMDSNKLRIYSMKEIHYIWKTILSIYNALTIIIQTF